MPDINYSSQVCLNLSKTKIVHCLQLYWADRRVCAYCLRWDKALNEADRTIQFPPSQAHQSYGQEAWQPQVPRDERLSILLWSSYLTRGVTVTSVAVVVIIINSKRKWGFIRTEGGSSGCYKSGQSNYVRLWYYWWKTVVTLSWPLEGRSHGYADRALPLILWSICWPVFFQRVHFAVHCFLLANLGV